MSVADLSRAPPAPRRPLSLPTRGALSRLVAHRLRADRKRTLAFGALFGLVAFIQPVAYRHSYPTISDRLGFARAFGEDKAVRLFYGVPRDLLTVGGYTAWRVGAMLALLAGVWAAVTTVAAMRGEEEAGRSELLLALALDRRTLLTATVLAFGIETVTLGSLLLAGLLAGGLPLGGSLLLSLATCASAVVLGAVGAGAAQLANTRRRALQLTVGCLALAFAVRVIGDTAAGLEWLRWLSPLGWLEQTRAFAHPVAVLLLAPVGLAAALFAGSARIAASRDIGRGLLPGNDSSATRLRLLGAPFAFAVRGELVSLGIWSAGIGAFGFLIGAISKSVSQAALPQSLRHALGRVGTGSIATPAGYLGLSSLFFVLLVSVFYVSQIAVLGREELGGRLQTLLPLPVGRTRWICERLLLCEAGGTALSLIAAVCLWAGAHTVGARVSLLTLLEAGANCLAVATLFGGFAAVIYARLPRAGAAVAYAAIVVAFLWQLFAAVLGAPAVLRNLTPFAHLGLAPGAPFAATAATVIGLIGVVALAIAPPLLRGRDLAAGG